MAYIEVRKNGKLVTRREVDDAKARAGCPIRLGSLGKVRLAVGESTEVGEFHVSLVGGPMPPSQDSLPAEQPAEADLPQAYPQVEGYQIIGRLGQGGMGTVWRAVQLGTQREVALKLLSPHRFGSAQSRARFEREVRLAARLECPGIARVYDAGVHRGMYYYAMELIAGLPLDEFAATRQLPRDGVLDLMAAVCRAVQFAHEHGVIHRDLKPSNILITDDARPHVLDFGLAKTFQDEQLDSEDLTVSMEGQVFGTPAYMSPEQAAGRHDRTDARTDVYALGVILYRLLTGQPPVDLAGTRQEVTHRILSGQVRPPRQLCPDLPASLEGVLLKAMALEPEDRYADADELAEAMEAAGPGRPHRRAPLRWAALAAVPVAVLLAVWALWPGGGKTPPRPPETSGPLAVQVPPAVPGDPERPKPGRPATQVAEIPPATLPGSAPGVEPPSPPPATQPATAPVVVVQEPASRPAVAIVTQPRPAPAPVPVPATAPAVPRPDAAQALYDRAVALVGGEQWTDAQGLLADLHASHADSAVLRDNARDLAAMEVMISKALQNEAVRREAEAQSCLHLMTACLRSGEDVHAWAQLEALRGPLADTALGRRIAPGLEATAARLAKTLEGRLVVKPESYLDTNPPETKQWKLAIAQGAQFAAGGRQIAVLQLYCERPKDEDSIQVSCQGAQLPAERSSQALAGKVASGGFGHFAMSPGAAAKVGLNALRHMSLEMLLPVRQDKVTRVGAIVLRRPPDKAMGKARIVFSIEPGVTTSAYSVWIHLGGQTQPFLVLPMPRDGVCDIGRVAPGVLSYRVAGRSGAALPLVDLRVAPGQLACLQHRLFASKKVALTWFVRQVSPSLGNWTRQTAAVTTDRVFGLFQPTTYRGSPPMLKLDPWEDGKIRVKGCYGLAVAESDLRGPLESPPGSLAEGTAFLSGLTDGIPARPDQVILFRWAKSWAKSQSVNESWEGCLWITKIEVAR